MLWYNKNMLDSGRTTKRTDSLLKESTKKETIKEIIEKDDNFFEKAKKAIKKLTTKKK